MMISKNRKPSIPGEILRKDLLEPMGFSQKELADHLGCDIKVINRLVNGHVALTVAIALRLAAAFQTTVEFWLNLQRAVNLYNAQKEIKKLPKALKKTGTE